MNAIRPDEDAGQPALDLRGPVGLGAGDDPRRSATLEFLKGVVRQIYAVIRRTERYMGYLYPGIEPHTSG